jgi:hypothetical protein
MTTPEHDPKLPLVVFVHIPKTAGTTLAAVLRTNEPGKRYRRVANVFKGGSGGAKTSVEYVRLRREGELDGVHLISGHFPLGVRDHLPKDRELRCCTILREPVDRTISHYFNIREAAKRRTGQKQWALPPMPEGASLEDAVEGGYLYDNLQTRMLSGAPDPFGEATDEMLERAKHNLAEELVTFGLTERFDESLVLTRRRLGLRTVLGQVSARVNPQRPRGKAIPDDMRAAAERCNQYDLELYRYAEGLFDAAPERVELDFQVEVAALEAAQAAEDVDPSVPAPVGFGGDERSWALLVKATAASIRQQHELAEVSALAQQITQHGDDVLDRLAELSGRDLGARGEGAALQDVRDMLLTLGAARRAPAAARELAPAGDGGSEPRGRKAARRTAARASGSGDGAAAAPSQAPGTRRRKPRTRKRRDQRAAEDQPAGPPDQAPESDA